MKKILILLIIIMVPLSAFAHPHSTINAYTHYYFDKNGFMGFYIQWIFDPLFSSQIVYECDLNGDLTFSQEELKQVEDYYFSRLDDYNFYTKLQLNDKPVPLGSPVNFSAEIDKDDDNVVIFTFYIPVNQPYGSKESSVFIDFTDPTGYSTFICPQRSLSVNGEVIKISKVEINRMGSILFTYN